MPKASPAADAAESQGVDEHRVAAAAPAGTVASSLRPPEAQWDRAVRRQPHGRVRRCSVSAAEAAEQLRVGAL